MPKVWIQETITLNLKEIFKNYKIEESNNKFYILINTSLFKWEYLSWTGCNNHYHGEYCEFDTYENAEKFALYWCKRGPLTKWFKEE